MGLECYGSYLTRATKDAAHQSVARAAIAGPLLLLSNNNDNLCRYGVALLPLKHAGTDFGTVRLLHEWAVRRGEYGHAQTLLHYLYSRLHPRLANFKACQIEVAAQHAFLLSRQGWVKEAKAKYQDLVDAATKEENLVPQARFLIQMAVTLLDANKQEFRAAVRPLRACLKLTGDHAMDVWHATATSIMAQVHYRMTKSNVAIAMIKGVLPTLLQHADDVWFVGEAYLTLTKCFMKREQVDEAMDALNKSCRYFLECQDFVRLREVYFWQARLYDLKNDVPQRDESSQRFVDVSQQMAKGTLRTGLGEIEDPSYMERMARRQVHS
jgi:tetratricopeptide (TPR) repeat protein